MTTVVIVGLVASTPGLPPAVADEPSVTQLPEAPAKALPTTLPSAAAANRPAETLPAVLRLVTRLADDDPDAREDARVALLGLRRTDLPLLREAVRRCRPLAPSQAAVLRGIVTHVYLSGEPYPYDPDNAVGFLGVQLGVDNALQELERGLAVVSRIPGFCAYRALRDSDVLLSISIPPAGQQVELTSTDQMIALVKAVPAGQEITFQLLRDGKLLSVPVTLDPRPRGLIDVAQTMEFAGRRSDKADEYWQRDFAPLLPAPLG